MTITYPIPYCFYRGTFSVEKLDEINTIIFDVDEKIIEFRIHNQSNNLLAIDWQFVMSEIKGDNNCEIKLVEETSIEIESGQDKTIEILFKFYRPESDLSETRINGEIKFISDSNEIPIKLQFRAPRNDIADRIEKGEETPEDVGEQVYNSWSDKINSRGLVFGEYITDGDSFKKFAAEYPDLNRLLRRHESSFGKPRKTFLQKFNDFNPLIIDMDGVNIGEIKQIYHNNESIEYKIEVNIINNSEEEKIVQILDVNCNNAKFGGIDVDDQDWGLPIIKMKSSLPVICEPNESFTVGCTLKLYKKDGAGARMGRADFDPDRKENIWGIYSQNPTLWYLIRFNIIDYQLKTKTFLEEPPIYYLPNDENFPQQMFEGSNNSFIDNLAFWLLNRIQWVSQSSNICDLLSEQLELFIQEKKSIDLELVALEPNHKEEFMINNDETFFNDLLDKMLEIQDLDSPFIQIKSNSNHRSDAIKLEISNLSEEPISNLSMVPILEDGNELFGEFNNVPNNIEIINPRDVASKVVKLDFHPSEHCLKIMGEIPQFTIRGVLTIKGILSISETKIKKQIPFYIDVSNSDDFLFRGD